MSLRVQGHFLFRWFNIGKAPLMQLRFVVLGLSCFISLLELYLVCNVRNSNFTLIYLKSMVHIKLYFSSKLSLEPRKLFQLILIIYTVRKFCRWQALSLRMILTSEELFQNHKRWKSTPPISPRADPYEQQAISPWSAYYIINTPYRHTSTLCRFD